MIPQDQCKDRVLYLLDSRNLSFGVFRTKTCGFLGLRYKFGDVFIDEEDHWDQGSPYGTAKALKELEALPETIQNENYLGSFCQKCHQEVKPEAGNHLHPGRWQHVSASDHVVGIPYAGCNKELHNWLEQMEEKYRDLIPQD